MSKRVIIGRVAPVHKGVFNLETSYSKLDAVSYQGSSYMAIDDSIGVLPTDTTKWQLLAEKGADGTNGQDGTTPVKGTDYFTESEINEFKNDVKDAVKTDLDFDNTIEGINQGISDLENNKVDRSVNNLANYYLKDEIYTREEVLDLIGQLQNFHKEVVTELPQAGVENIMYLVPKSTSETDNIYDEYLYTNNAWEKIGDTEIDLTNYVKKTDYATQNTGGVVKVNGTYALNIYNGSIYPATKTYQEYLALGNGTFVGKGTLENIIAGKELVNKTYVDTAIGDIDSVLDAINGEEI